MKINSKDQDYNVESHLTSSIIQEGEESMNSVNISE